MSDATDKARRLNLVRGEAKSLAKDLVDLMRAEGLISGVVPDSWSMTVTTRDGVTLGFRVNGSTAPQAPQPPKAPTKEPLRKKVTIAQKNLIKRLSAELEIGQVDGQKLDEASIAELDLLPGAEPRETASRIISSLESSGGGKR